MLDMYLKEGIQHDDDFVILTQIFDGEEQILLEKDFDSFKEYELEDYTREFYDGSEMIESMEWNEELTCFEYKDFRLYVVGFKII